MFWNLIQDLFYVKNVTKFSMDAKIVEITIGHLQSIAGTVAEY